MDKNIAEVIKNKEVHSAAFAKHGNSNISKALRPPCQQSYCYTDKFPFNLSASLPKSVDLREYGLVTKAKDQNMCGSCWAFSLAACFENEYMLINKSADALKNIPLEWQDILAANTNETLDLSETYILVNDFGFSNYCKGGSSATAVDWIYSHDLGTELEQNFPYSEDNSTYLANKPTQTFTEPVLQTKYIPF